MNKLAALGAVIFSVNTLVGCATYKSSESGLSKIGYEEKQLDDGSYQLTYYGSGFSEHEELIRLWHKRAGELCGGQQYQAKTTNEHWTSDSYVVLPPFFILSKDAAPSIEGRLRCGGETLNDDK